MQKTVTNDSHTLGYDQHLDIYDIFALLMAHLAEVKQIVNARGKTDKQDVGGEECQ